MSPFMTWSLLVKAHGPHRPMGAERAGCPWELQMTDRGPEMSSDLPKVTQLGNARAWIPTPVSCTRVPAPHCPAEGRGQIAATRSCPEGHPPHTRQTPLSGSSVSPGFPSRVSRCILRSCADKRPHVTSSHWEVGR